jgi:GTP-binding protein
VPPQLKPSPDPEAIEVHGRGELQMGILIEEMRRESYELCVAPPKVRCWVVGMWVGT